MVFFEKAKDDEIDKLYASAYITYSGDTLLDQFDDDIDDEQEEEEDDIVQIILNQFDDELFALDEDSSFMDEWFDNNDGQQWIISNEAVSSFYDYQWENDQIWDEIDNEIITMNGNSISRKCMHMWGQRLCLCQFLGWLDSHKYKCIQNTQNVLEQSNSMLSSPYIPQKTTYKQKKIPQNLHKQEYKYYDEKLARNKKAMKVKWFC